MSNAIRTTTLGALQVPWLQDAVVARPFLATMGEQKDSTIDIARVAIKLRWTSGTLAQQVAARIGATLDDATLDTKRLQLIGSGFGLSRLGSQSNAQFQDYIDRAWDIWGAGGTASSIIDALTSFGLPQVEIVEEWMPAAKWGAGDYGWRTRIIVGPDFGALGWAPLAFPFVLDGTVALGIAGATQGQLNDISGLVRRWKIAPALTLDIVFRFGDAPVFTADGLAFPFVLDGSTGYADSMPIASPILCDALTLPFTLGPTYLRG